MASTYVNNLRLNEMATGDGSGTWGTTTNTNLELIGQALGYGTRAIANASTDNITIADGASDSDRAMYLKLTGGGQACTVTLLPNTASKVWMMENATSYTLTFTCGSGANVAILAGETKFIATDGAGSGGIVYDVLTDVNLAGTTKTAALTNAGALSNQGTVTVGVDDTGYDVKFFGATSGAYMLWDESADDLKLVGAAGFTVAGDIDVDGTTNLDVVDIDGAVNMATTLLVTGAITGSSTIAGTRISLSDGVDDAGSAGSESVFNNGGTTADFRVESTGNDHMLFVDGGNNNVAIGHSTATGAKLAICDGGNAQIQFFPEISTDTNLTQHYDPAASAYMSAETRAAAYSFKIGTSEVFNIAADGSLSTPTAGTSNVRFGVNAGDSIASGGNYNVAIGDEAGTALTTGDHNVAMGYAALTAEDAHGYNTAIGGRSLATLNAGAEGYNVAVGYDSGRAMTTGIYNTLIGGAAGDALTDADSNVAIGTSALGADTLGSKSTAVGQSALTAQNLTTATDVYNTAVGFYAGVAVTTGTKNTLIGGLAGTALTGGGFSGSTRQAGSDWNTAIGTQALYSDTKGSKSTAVGQSALFTQNFTSATDSFNTAVGFEAGLSVTTGAGNTIVGALAGDAISTGPSNTLIGKSAGSLIVSAEENTCVGQNSGVTVTGSYNNCFGAASGSYGVSLTTGTKNNLFGNYVHTSAVDSVNQTVFGYNVAGSADSTLTFGTGTTDTTCTYGSTTWSAPSDSRMKEDVVTSTAGLSFINALRPVTYKWKKEKDISTALDAYVEGSETRVMNDKTNHGFIAQEVKTVIDAHSEIKNGFSMWMEKDSDGQQRVAPSALVPMLVKAIQEQNALIESLTARITTLEG